MTIENVIEFYFPFSFSPKVPLFTQVSIPTLFRVGGLINNHFNFVFIINVFYGEVGHFCPLFLYIIMLCIFLVNYI